MTDQSPKILSTQPYQVYAVGGCVRDKLLNLPIHERDWVVVGADELTLLNQGYQRVGRSFPVFLHPKTKDEYALARKEKKSGRGYQGFICDFSPDVTLEEDLKRRDLTINAIAEDEQGHLVDPYHGQQDIEARVLRHVSDAFSEDPVRILRVARFMARFANLGFEVAEETLELMRGMVQSGEVDALVPERVWQEMVRALSEKTPSAFFETLRACGALARIFPALDKLWGVPQPPQHHPEIDTGVHVMMALTQACRLSEDPQVRFATLCHDLGKGETPPELWPKHHGHEHRGLPLIEDWCSRYAVPTEFRVLAKLVAKNHGLHGKVHELRPQTILKLFEELSAFRQPERLEKFLLACEADARGRLGKEDLDYPQSNFFRKAFLLVQKVDVKALMDQGFSGPALGQAIHRERLARIAVFKRTDGV